MGRTGTIGIVDRFSCCECRRYNPTECHCCFDNKELDEFIDVDLYREVVVCRAFRSIHEPDPDHNPNQMALFPEMDEHNSA
jgi:hypothetical protein